MESFIATGHCTITACFTNYLYALKLYTESRLINIRKAILALRETILILGLKGQSNREKVEARLRFMHFLAYTFFFFILQRE